MFSLKDLISKSYLNVIYILFPSVQWLEMKWSFRLLSLPLPFLPNTKKEKKQPWTVHCLHKWQILVHFSEVNNPLTVPMSPLNSSWFLCSINNHLYLFGMWGCSVLTFDSGNLLQQTSLPATQQQTRQTSAATLQRANSAVSITNQTGNHFFLLTSMLWEKYFYLVCPIFFLWFCLSLLLCLSVSLLDFGFSNKMFQFCTSTKNFKGIQAHIRALPRIDTEHRCAGTSRAMVSNQHHGQISGTISKMALKNAGTLVLRNRFSAGLKYQLEFPWNF